MQAFWSLNSSIKDLKTILSYFGSNKPLSHISNAWRTFVTFKCNLIIVFDLNLINFGLREYYSEVNTYNIEIYQRMSKETFLSL